MKSMFIIGWSHLVPLNSILHNINYRTFNTEHILDALLAHLVRIMCFIVF